MQQLPGRRLGENAVECSRQPHRPVRFAFDIADQVLPHFNEDMGVTVAGAVAKQAVTLQAAGIRFVVTDSQT